MGKNILVLAAHPDDETLGCGATISRLASEGNKVHLITFTDGVSAREANDFKNRNLKLEKVSEILGIQSYIAADFPDNQMDAVPLLDACKFIEKNLPFDPDMIFTHHPGCLNVDHSTVFRATLTVFRPQRGSSCDVLSYYVPSSTDYNPLSNFNGNVFYDVESFVDQKMKALEVYDEEMRAYPHSRSYDNVMNLMKTWGCEVGLRYAEKFQSIRRVVC
jgi:LmbE family N-acetylglucosaminyl deacetylase